MKWWLISDETANEVLRTLKMGLAIAGGAITTSTFVNALRSLESGMHETDAVPGDYAEKTEGGAG